MLKKFLIASAAGLLLAACQQQPQMASPPPATQLKQLFVVYFNTGQSDLSPEAQATITQAAATFRQGGTAVAVKGHADRVGDQGMNLRLSLARTAAVKAALMRDGVPESAIRSGSLGEENLPVPTADQVPERLNRSVHITVIGAAAHERQGLLRRACQEVAFVFPDGRIWSGAAGDRPVRCRKLRRGHHDAGEILTDDRIVLPSRYL